MLTAASLRAEGRGWWLAQNQHAQSTPDAPPSDSCAQEAAGREGCRVMQKADKEDEKAHLNNYCQRPELTGSSEATA